MEGPLHPRQQSPRCPVSFWGPPERQGTQKHTARAEGPRLFPSYSPPSVYTLKLSLHAPCRSNAPPTPHQPPPTPEERLSLLLQTHPSLEHPGKASGVGGEEQGKGTSSRGEVGYN